MQRQPDITLALKELNDWHPGVDLDKGLQQTIDYFRNKLIN